MTLIPSGDRASDQPWVIGRDVMFLSLSSHRAGAAKAGLAAVQEVLHRLEALAAVVDDGA